MAVVLWLPSCEDYLEVEPETTVGSSSVFKTQEGVLFALNGVYTRLKLKGFYGTEFPVIGDASSDNGKIPSDRESAGANADRIPFAYTLNLNATNTSILWSDAYTVVNNINQILENIDQAADITDEVRDQVTAECRVLRAFAHFCLVQLFAQDFNFTPDQSHLGVPIVTTTDSNNKPARDAVGDVFAFIFTEMNEAIPVLQNANTISREGADYYYLSYYAAVAMRARMHFYVADYPAALADANTVINDGPYTLIQNYTTSLYESAGLGQLEFIDDWAGQAIVESESIFQLYINEDNTQITTNRSIIDIYNIQ